MKWLKFIVALFLLMVVVVLIAIATIKIFIDPNKLKPELIREVKARTGYELKIDGPLTWVFFPQFAIKMPAATLQLSKEAPFVELKNIQMRMSFAQLFMDRYDLSGRFYIGHLKFHQFKAENIRFKLFWIKNQLEVYPITADLYQGTAEAKLIGSQFTATPLWQFHVFLEDVSIKPLLLDLHATPLPLTLAGKTFIRFHGQTQGRDHAHLLRALKGNLLWRVKPGKIEGLDINYFVEVANALLNRMPLKMGTPQRNTDFKELEGRTLIEKGVMRTVGILTTDTFKAGMAGAFDLNNQALNFQVQVRPLQVTKVNWMIPILISGTLAHPEVKLDMLTLKMLLNRASIQEAHEQLGKEIKTLPEKADKFLKKFMGK